MVKILQETKLSCLPDEYYNRFLSVVAKERKPNPSESTILTLSSFILIQTTKSETFFPSRRNPVLSLFSQGGPTPPLSHLHRCPLRLPPQTPFQARRLPLRSTVGIWRKHYSIPLPVGWDSSLTGSMGYKNTTTDVERARDGV